MKRIVVATLIALPLLSCSPSWSADLTRPQAKAILSRSKVFTSTPGLYWRTNGAQEFVTEGGQDNPEFAKVIIAASNGTVTVKTSLAFRVEEITGIAEAGLQGMKEVFFRWSIVNVPDVLVPLVVVGGTGRAIMRLYDDGWRLESGPDLTSDTTPPTLTAAQQRQREAFKGAVLNRQQEQQREAQLQQREAQLRKDKLEAAMKPTKVLYHFHTMPEIGWDPTTRKHLADDVDVTDADLTVTVLGRVKPLVSHIAWRWVTSIEVIDSMRTGPGTKLTAVRVSYRAPEGALVSVYTSTFDLATREEAQQVQDEIHKAHQAWVATYGNLMPH